MEAESQVLGSMLLDAEVCDEIQEIISSRDDFYLERHRIVYDAIVDIRSRGRFVDVTAILDNLRDRGLVKDIDGAQYIIDIAESTSSPVAGSHHARTVRDKATMRRMIEALGGALHRAYHDQSLPAQEHHDRIEADLFKLGDSTRKISTSSAAELMQAHYAKLESDDGKHRGLSTGWHELDDLLRGGLHDGELIIVAARPSVGKSAFMLQMAVAVARSSPCAIYSLEMSQSQLGERLVSMVAGISSARLRKSLLSDQEMERARLASSDACLNNVFVEDSPGVSVMQIRASVRRKSRRLGVKAVFVDYLQLVAASDRHADNREQEVASISRGLKALALELNIPVVVLSQLNRKADESAGTRPRLSQLRESGSIEQDADVVIMLHRRDYQVTPQPGQDMDHTAEVIVAKQRNGPSGMVELVWNGTSVRFEQKAYV